MFKSKLRIHTNVYKKTHRSGKSTWVVRWRCPESGGIKVAAAGKTRAEAKAIELQVRAELLEGRKPFSSQQQEIITFSAVAEGFLVSPRFKGANANWQSENEARLKQWILPEIGALNIRAITTQNILQVYTKIKAAGRGRCTIAKTHTLVCLVFDHYQDHNPDFLNRFRTIRGFSDLFGKKQRTRDINFLTEEELSILFQVALRSSNQLLLPLIVFLAHSGLRRSEALNLKWTDVDEKDGFIHVRRSKTGLSRIVPLECKAKDAIQSLRGRSDYVFAYTDGRKPHEDSFLKPLRKIAKEAGIVKRIDLHTFRHSYGSNKIRSGWGLQKVSKILGHSDIKITSEVYTHLLDGDLCVQDSVYQGLEPQSVSVQQIADALVMALANAPKKDARASGQEAKLLGAMEQVLARVASVVGKLEEHHKTAPSLLRSQNDPQKDPLEQGQGLPELCRLVAGFEEFLNGRGGGIRTHDLFVPKECQFKDVSGLKDAIFREISMLFKEFQTGCDQNLSGIFLNFHHLLENACSVFAS